MVTIYKNAKSQEHVHVNLEVALRRIKTGHSILAVKKVREAKDKEEADEFKKNLPAVCFSGKFGPKHEDQELTEHSGFIVLDFDKIDPILKKQELIQNPYVYACWISPSGKGVKALIKIADGSKHRSHFEALKEEFPHLDPSGINPSRLCFESFDPELYLNPESQVWTKVIQIESTYIQGHNAEDHAIFEKLLKWMASKGRIFQSGERNHFIFIIASACCRYGIPEDRAVSLISMYVSSDSGFSAKETKEAIKSAYRKNAKSFNSMEFDSGRFVDKKTKKDVTIKLDHEDIETLTKQNVIYGAEVNETVLDIYRKGYKQVFGINVPEIDHRYKRKPGELLCLTGYGNMGKSTYWMWYLMMRAIIFGERTAIFTPESGSASDFYFDLSEIFFGCACHHGAYDRPTEEEYQTGLNWIYDHFFYVEPSELSPTPEVIKEIFLGMIVGRGVKSVVIDPFNQLANDYGSSGGRSDKYLETFLSDCARFAKQNLVNFDIVAHPRTPREKDAMGNYVCPDQFSIADGTMWNNKCDNVLVYHRLFGFSDPANGAAEIHSKKIRRQKIVGEKGVVEIYYSRSKRRFLVGDIDYMEQAKNTYLMKSEKAVRPNINFFDPYNTDPLDASSY